MTNDTIKTSPQTYARIGGVFYLILIIVGFYSVIFVRGKLIVPGNAAVTAHNIMAARFLWRTGIVADLIMHICDVFVMLALYVLLKPVNKNLALLALLFTLIQTAVSVANKLNLFAALFPLGNEDYLKTIDPHQLYAQVYLSLKLHDYGFGIALVFFGFTCLVVGYLIFKSDYLPKVLGILMQIAGLCYLTNSFTLFLVPAFQTEIFPLILFPSFIAELSLCLWLIVKGVNVTKWNERASFVHL